MKKTCAAVSSAMVRRASRVSMRLNFRFDTGVSLRKIWATGILCIRTTCQRSGQRTDPGIIPYFMAYNLEEQKISEKLRGAD